MQILLRDVVIEDLPTFFEQQADQEANLMAALPAREREAFITHWTAKFLDNPAAQKKTVTVDGAIAGNVLCWKDADKQLVGYWFGKEYWGQGIATRALREFLTQIPPRPLQAYIAKHNVASARVLEKCGFKFLSQGKMFSKVHGHEIEDAYFILV